jgi:thioredoxin reductase (NADPH)
MNSPHVPPAIIIGAGPAGLTAACYLSRFRRTPVVFNRGDSRARWIPKSHNMPGFPAGCLGRGLQVQKLRSIKRYSGFAPFAMPLKAATSKLR